MSAVALLLLLSSFGMGESLAQRLLLRDGYDVNEWPNAESGIPTNVSVQLFINSFGSLNAANMDFTVDVFLRQRWRDPRLANITEKRERITVTSKELQNQIWKPDTFFNNVKDAELHKVTMPNVLLRIEQTGDVLYSIRTTLRLSCYMELEDYPFDFQNCGISISSYANTDDVINYDWDEENPIDLPDQLEIAQFDLLNFTARDTTQVFVTGNFSGLIVYFNLRRQNGYHVLQTYIPTILIVSISWVSFWLDPNAVPGRVSLGVTTLLTLTTLASGIRASLPPVSYVKAIDVWIGTCMILVFGALLEFTLVNWLTNKKIVNNGQTLFKIPRLLAGSDYHETKDAEEKDSTVKPPQTYVSYARALDRLCRVLFPGVFLVFNLAYWPYYLVQHYESLPNSLV